MTLLFADVTGSTALGERLDAERLHRVLDAYFAAMRAEIEAEGGTVEKYIGDAIVAAFGVPVTHEDDPARALRAALRMQRRLGALNEQLRAEHGVELRIRIGVNTGEVLAALDAPSGEPMFTGDAVNTAARFEQHAEPGEILASERTVRVARGFAVEPAGALAMKGKAERQRAFRVIAEDAGASRRVLPGLSAPMVGREPEMDVLRAALVQVANERRPQLVTIYGEPGVGKSRLTHEFIAWASGGGGATTAVQGRCLPYGDGVTYWPLAEMLKAVAGVLDTDTPMVALERVRALAGRLLASRDEPERAAAALAFTMGLDDPQFPFGRLDPKLVRSTIEDAWRDFFSALAADGPVVAVFEDIHWADAALLDLLDEVASHVDGAVLFVCPSRPELIPRRPAWGGGKRNYSSLSLEPLTDGESDRLMHELLDVEDLPASVQRRVLDRAGGNPFFLEEIVRQLIDAGAIRMRRDRWHASAGIEEVDIPDTVQAVLAARIDLLEASTRDVIRAAAVVGRVFWPGPIARLVDRDASDVDDALRTLEDRDLVRSRRRSTVGGEREFIFKHVLTRDVAYETLPKAERATAHAAVAAWIEDVLGERSGEFVELLAHHYSEAYRAGRESGTNVIDLAPLRTRAFDLALRASREARARTARRKAQRFADRALDLADGHRERAVAYEALGEACFDDYRGTLAWNAFTAALDELLQLEDADPLTVARVCHRAVSLPLRWAGSLDAEVPFEEARRILDIGLKFLPEGDTPERVQLLAVDASWPFGYADRDYTDEEMERLTQAGMEAVAIARRLGRPDLESAALDHASTVFTYRGLYGEALRLEERRLELVPRVSDLAEIGDTYSMLAWTHAELGHAGEAVRWSQAGMEALAEQAPNLHAHLLAWLAWGWFRLGRWDDALDAYRRLRDALEERADAPPNFVTHAYGTAALIHERRGERAEADRAIGAMQEVLRRAGRSATRPWAWMLPLLVARGELEESKRQLNDRPGAWRVHAYVVLEAAADRVIAGRAWDEATDVAAEIRALSRAGDLEGLAAVADEVDGLATLASGDPAGVALMEAARGRYASLGQVWHAARCELELAEEHGASPLGGRHRPGLGEATAVFERLRSVKELERIRALTRDA